MTPLSPTERTLLWTMALFGLVGVNGVFVYGLLRPEVLVDALSNPITLAFLIEALVLTVALGGLLVKWRATRLHPAWFLALALLGSLAFALPLALLVWPGRSVEAGPAARDSSG